MLAAKPITLPRAACIPAFTLSIIAHPWALREKLIFPRMLAAALPALPTAWPALEAIPLTRLLQERLERFLAWSWPRPHVLATAEPTRWTVPLALFDWLRTIPAIRVQIFCV